METMSEHYFDDVESYELKGMNHLITWLLHLLAGLVILTIASTILAFQITALIAIQIGFSITLSESFAIGALQLLIAVIVSYILIKLSIAIQSSELWAFSTSLYLNLLLLILLATMGTIGMIFIFLPIITLISLFLPNIREYWFPLFKEDMGPRIKEIRYSLYLVRKSPLVVAGVIIIVSFVVLAFLAPFFTPYGPEQRIWADYNLPPGSPSTDPNMPIHIWGTDDSGGDVFSRIFWAAQVDLRISVTVVAVAVTVGTLIGAISGFYGGKIDELVMRITDVFFAFPGLVLAMAIVMALGERSLDNIAIALMVTWWPGYARLVRGQVLAEREKLYVEAARSIGASDMRILLVHIIPNTIQPIIVSATMDTGGVLLTAAGLSCIGFGPPAGVDEWGLMISIGQFYYSIAPWAVFFPGFAILMTSLAFNLVGDGIRDIMDPKLRRR